MSVDLRERIHFDRHALDEAIEEQSGLFLQVSEAFTLAVSRRDAAKSAMEQEFARACGRARREEKKTEAAVKEAAQLDKKFLETEGEYLTAKQEADMASTLRESFDMRGRMLREMAQLYIAGYFQLSAVGDKTKRNVDDAASRDARRILNEARKARR